MFERWLKLFGEKCRDQFDENVAHAFREKAARIAETLKLAVFDRPWPSGSP